MRNSPWYIVGLLAFVLGATGYVYATSEVTRLTVRGKHLETARTRHGDAPLYVLDTDQGALPILQFPIIGYWSGVDAVYADVKAGSTVQARVGEWPPAFVGSASRRYVLGLN